MPHCLGFTAVAEWRGDVTPLMHAVAHGPASVRNLFSRLHWPRDRPIPGSWMVGSLIRSLGLMYKLKRVGARTDPCGRPFFCTLHELLMSPMWTRNRRCSKSSSITLTARHGRTFDSFTNNPYKVVLGDSLVHLD